jgi:hypothetical protein
MLVPGPCQAEPRHFILSKTPDGLEMRVDGLGRAGRYSYGVPTISV